METKTKIRDREIERPHLRLTVVDDGARRKRDETTGYIAITSFKRL